jgi:hypothetical protein
VGTQKIGAPGREEGARTRSRGDFGEARAQSRDREGRNLHPPKGYDVGNRRASMTIRLLPLLLASIVPQEPAASGALDAIVLTQAGQDYTAREVVDRVTAWDASLAGALANPEYLRLYLDSPVFAEQVRAFSDALLVAHEALPAASRAALEREALAWAADRGLPADAAAALAKAGIEIETRARLLALQPEESGSNELRQQMMRSIPEFFGQLQISWIRIPLFDTHTGAVLGEKERRAFYDLLDEVGRRLKASEIEWKNAVDEYSQDPLTQGREGRVGILDRTLVNRFEEGFLRPLFTDLGFRRIDGVLLRGPILTARWAYLARIEAVVIGGVVELERVRPRVQRSLHEHLLRLHLTELAAGVDRTVRLPLAP